MSVGYIYVLSNPTMGVLLKIGYTCGKVEDRAKELAAATGVPSPFTVEYFRLTDDVEAVEALVHLELAQHRHAVRKEFFSVALLDARETIERLVKKPVESFALRPLSKSPEEPLPTCRRCGAIFLRSNKMQFCPKCGF